MCLFRKKKTNAEKNGNNAQLIEHNAKSVKALMVLCENEEFNEKLVKLEEELKFLTPSVNKNIYKADEKITAAIEDLKIALTKNPKADSKAESLLKDVKVLIAERNSNM